MLALDVIAAILVSPCKRILINFFCYGHQHGRHGFWHLSPTGQSENTPYKIIGDAIKQLANVQFCSDMLATPLLYSIATTQGLLRPYLTLPIVAFLEDNITFVSDLLLCFEKWRSTFIRV